MKAILEFVIPEEAEEFRVACDAFSYKGTLEDLASWLRASLKHRDLSPEVAEAYTEIREHLFNLLEDRGVRLD